MSIIRIKRTSKITEHGQIRTWHLWGIPLLRYTQTNSTSYLTDPPQDGQKCE